MSGYPNAPERAHRAGGSPRGNQLSVDVVDGRVGLPTSWAPVLSGSSRPRQLRWTAVTVAAAALFVACATAAFAAVEVREYRSDHAGRLLPGVAVEGVDLSGLPADEARARVAAAVDPQLDGRFEVAWGGLRWDATPRRLGATADVDAALDDALLASERASWPALLRMRFLGDDLDVERDVAVTHSEEGVAGWVANLAAGIDHAPVEADVAWTGEGVLFAQAEVGRLVQQPESVQAVLGALREGRPLTELSIVETPVAADQGTGQVLVVRQSDFELDLYQDGQLVKSWDVTTGTGDYPTPTGEFTVSVKREAPTWVNPDPDGWGADLPASIGPGPSNPLGLRALNWVDEAGADDGIRFHGTNAVGQLGRAASHGCVRLANADVVELFDMVEVGARILSVR